MNAAQPHAPTLIYDGTCRFCTAGVARLRRLIGRPVAAVPSQSADARRLVPQLDEADFDRQLLLVTARGVYGGAEAVARALSLNPWLRLPAALYFVPGLRQVADALYRWVARRRHCLSGACRVD